MTVVLDQLNFAGLQEGRTEGRRQGVPSICRTIHHTHQAGESRDRSLELIFCFSLKRSPRMRKCRIHEIDIFITGRSWFMFSNISNLILAIKPLSLYNNPPCFPPFVQYCVGPSVFVVFTAGGAGEAQQPRSHSQTDSKADRQPTLH